MKVFNTHRVVRRELVLKEVRYRYGCGGEIIDDCDRVVYPSTQIVLFVKRSAARVRGLR
jgi:hypothetical protein